MVFYHTPKFFDYNSIDLKNITTGYIDRQVYVENPLTTQDFRDILVKVKQNIWIML